MGYREWGWGEGGGVTLYLIEVGLCFLDRHLISVELAKCTGLPGQCAVWSTAVFGESSESPENIPVAQAWDPRASDPSGGS